MKLHLKIELGDMTPEEAGDFIGSVKSVRDKVCLKLL
jgi:hypothetical protein